MNEKKKKLTRQEFKDQKEFVDTIMYGIKAPLIVTPSYANSDSVPKTQRDEHRLHCIAEAVECVNLQQATDYDAMLYYSYISLEHPIGTDGHDEYGFLFQKYHPEQAKQVFSKVIELTAIQRLNIVNLKKWIYKKQIEGMKK